MARDELLYVLDLHPFEFVRSDKVANGGFRRLDGQRGPRWRAMRTQAIDRAFQIAAIRANGAGDKGEHRGRNIELRILRSGSRDPGLQDLQPQGFVEGANFDTEAYAEARADTLI